MRHASIVVVVLAGIVLASCKQDRAPERPNTFAELEYLPYRQPSRSTSYPAMVLLLDVGNGYYSKRDRGETSGFEGEPFVWGMRYRVRVEHSYNSYTRHTSTYIVDLLKAEPDLDDPFRLHSISKPFFRADGRAFIDQKELVCGDVCDELDAAIAAEKRFDIVARFGHTVEAPIEVTAIEAPSCYESMDCWSSEYCCDTPDGFRCISQDPADRCPEDRRVGPSRDDYGESRYNAGPRGLP